MTLARDGWIDGRGYYVVRDRETGESEKYICEGCGGELEADPDVFAAHDCENYRDRIPRTVEATDAAIRLARERGVTLSEVEGTGADGKIIKADVEREV